jgi:hypothetical protein
MSNEEMNLRRIVLRTVIGLFIGNTTCAISCVYLVGFGLMTLPPTLMHYLMVQTIGLGASVILLMARSLFPAPQRKEVRAR